jgi:hypothetical protein
MIGIFMTLDLQLWCLNYWCLKLTNRTPQQYKKSNSAALKWWNYEKTQTKKFDQCEYQLFMLKEGKKNVQKVILGKNWHNTPFPMNNGE